MKNTTLKGFRDFIGKELIQRKEVIKIIEEVFLKYGFEPLETPALEYFDVLMNNYGEDEKLVYNFEDFGKRRVGLKYDLTVPTSRVLASNQDKIVLPWKRYQIQPVWRADNPQLGRYRELWQCDVDTLGTDSLIADAEIIRMGIEIFNKLGLGDVKIRLNNRKILNALVKLIDREDKFSDIIVAIDKWDKIGKMGVSDLLVEKGLTQDEATKLIINIEEAKVGNLRDNLDELDKIIGDIQIGKTGVDELREIVNIVDNDEYIIIDPTIARGLSYYTGPIWEWDIQTDNIGSLGGGGRYDNLIGKLTNKDIPATGSSFGLERIIDVLRLRGQADSNLNQIKVLVTVFNKELINKSIMVANMLRDKGINTFVYPEVKKLGKQFEYADKKAIPYVIVIGDEENANNTVTIKNMNTKTQETISINDIDSQHFI